MSKKNVAFKYKSHTPGRNSIQLSSFCRLHETVGVEKGIEAIYEEIEHAWDVQGFRESTGRTFYKHYGSAMAQIKSRSTKLKNRGFKLSDIGFANPQDEDMSDQEVHKMISEIHQARNATDGLNSDHQARQSTRRHPGTSAYVPNGF